MRNDTKAVTEVQNYWRPYVVPAVTVYGQAPYTLGQVIEPKSGGPAVQVARTGYSHADGCYFAECREVAR